MAVPNLLFFCVALCLSICRSAFDLPPISFIFLMPANASKSAANYTAPAINVALERIKDEGIIHTNATDIQWNVSETQESPMITAKQFENVYTDENHTITAIFGGYSPHVCGILESISAALDVGYVGVDCSVDTMNVKDRQRPETFISMTYWRPSMAPLFCSLMDSFGWNRVGILATSDDQSSYYGLAVKKAVEEQGHTAFLILCTLDDVPEKSSYSAAEVKEVKRMLDEMRKQARVFFFAMDADIAARILLVARAENMYNGEYAFVVDWMELIRGEQIGSNSTIWDLVRDGLISLEPSYVEHDTKFLAALNKVPRIEYHLSWINPPILSDVERRWEYLARDLYAAVLLYAYALNKTIASVGSAADLRNGTLVMQHARGINFTGVPDMVYIDEKGVRRSNWSIKNLKQDGTSVVLVETDKNMTVLGTWDLSQVTWPGGSHTVPPDRPACGWEKELCIVNKEWIYICVYSVIGCLVFICVLCGIIFWRRMKLRMEKRTLEEWQVAWSRVTVIGDHIVGRLSIQETSRLSLDAVRRLSLQESRRQSLESSTGERRSISKNVNYKLFALTGYYKGKKVAIKKVHRETVDVYQPLIYNELKQLFHISHDNVNPFVGVCAEAPNVCVLMLYADRGSLQDVLAETKYDINWEFRICLALDIVQGMEYLHESPVGPHGRLTSSNCVVDSKWQCRITDYGLKQFKQSVDPTLGSYRLNSDLLWTAPEILRKPENDRMRIYGTKNGDVYSFGIIVCELITKEMPYNTELETKAPEDIVRALMEGSTIRPVLPPPENPVADKWNRVAALCWHDLPDVRPNFRTVRATLRRIVGGKVPSLMHRMQTMLQDGLKRKKTEIAAERRKTQTVIANLLPKSVAAIVITGNEVNPQKFESVTICLCETQGIYSVKNLAPAQMTDLLTSLFSVYDDVIKKFDVTQVSSRGTRELVMLVGGLPYVTEKHSEDICDLSMELISESSAFKTSLAPKFSAKLKISVHTGVAVVGVIGETAPRYCVVGPAVEALKEIHSSSTALGIRISEKTHDRIKNSGDYSFERGKSVSLKDLPSLKTYWLFRKSTKSKSPRSSAKTKHRSPSGGKESVL